HGVERSTSRLPAGGLPLLQEQLKAAGYHTAAFTTCLFVSATFGFERGFDHFDYEYVPAEKVNPKVLDYLSEKTGEPFFLFLHYYDVHHPFTETNPYGESFGDDHMPHLQDVLWRLKKLRGLKVSDLTAEQRDWLADTFHNYEVMSLLTAEENRDMKITKEILLNLSAVYLQKVDPRAMESIMGAYDNGVAYMDKRLAELFDSLKAFPWYENTIFIITSDHGEAFNQHPGITGHGGPPFRELARIPLIMTGPGLPRAARIHDLVMSIDIAPTIMELAGLPPVKGYQGLSLTPAIGGDLVESGEPFPDRPILSGSEETLRLSLQEGDWKLVMSLDIDRSWLFDLSSPEGEHEDLSKADPERVEKMKEALIRSERYNRKAAEMLRLDEVELDESARELLRELGYLK
ncbi:MAG: sulfatase, partial [Planctomycetota bacterium]